MSQEFYIKDHNGQIFFKQKELQCKGSGLFCLAPGFAKRLAALRTELNEPMIVASCCRSAQYNKRVGGVSKSFHICDQPVWDVLGASAVDIITPNKFMREKLIALAKKLGWTIGLYRNFVHLDRRIDYTIKPQIIFNGGS
jgi:peptidase M15-like protein